jgi:4-aminobutyrate aminotransferase-like enzyme
MVVTEHAYHGSTDLTISTSPEELGIENLPTWVATTPSPREGTIAPNGVRAAISRLRSSGVEIAAFACDTVFSSDGIFDPPAGYFAAVFDEVRSHGGLCIADEVQAGFGRVGTRFWGFAVDEAIPDIVTLGKPMGNGYPLAAVITSAEIAAEFSRHDYFFSTFAGSPVAAAVGGAVLDVMHRDALPARAERVGAYVRSGLRELAAKHLAAATVRGPGMFIGFDVRDQSGQPDPGMALAIQNRMRAHQVLIGRTGVNGNVLKIRPPLVFAEIHADILLETLDAVLTEVVR